MSRQRFIHPEFFTSEDTCALSRDARLLFAGMFTLADDLGRGRGSVRSLKASIFPADQVSWEEMERWVEEITKRKLVRVYEVDGAIYYEVVKWKTWQRPKYVAASKIPPCPPNPKRPARIVPESAPDPDQTRDKVGHGLGREGLGSNGVGRGGVGSSPLMPTAADDASSPLQVSDPDPEPGTDPDPIPGREDYRDGLAELRRIMRRNATDLA